MTLCLDGNEMDIEGQNNQLSLGLDLQYSETIKNLFVYASGNTSFGKIKYQRFGIDKNDTVDFKSERYDKSWSVGLNIALGIEYFINKRF